MAALLPLALLAIVGLDPGLLAPQQGATLRAGLAAAAAVATAVGLLATTVLAMRGRRLASLLDAAALGVLSGTLTLAALRAVGPAGIAIGLTLAAMALAARPLTGNALAGGRHAHAVAAIGLFVGVELALVVELAGAPWVAIDGFTSALCAVAAILLGVGAWASYRTDHDETHFSVLVLVTSGTLALGLAGTTPGEALVAVATVSLAAALLGTTRALAAAKQLPSASTALVPFVEPPVADPAPELSETARLVRELRGTLDELIAARRTVELQREEIERVMRNDSITGVSGRAAILGRLRIEAAEARRYAHPLAVVLLDIDGFDDLNRRFGMEAGDAILREVALRLRLRVREADALGRIGDDAFLAILPHTDEAGAVTFAEAFRARLLDHPIEMDAEPVLLGVSIGIALVRPGMDLDHDDLFNAAVEALASAKAAGGNRIAFDRMHGLARLDERRREAVGDPDERAGSVGGGADDQARAGAADQ